MANHVLFANRAQAGKELARALLHYKEAPNTIVLGLPRGGVVCAYEVARALHLPLDIMVTRKIGAPHNPELAIGALMLDGQVLWHDDALRMLGLQPADLRDVVAAELKEAARRMKTYRADRGPLNLQGKTVILVDDGIATGATMFAAIQAARAAGADKIVIAVPVGPEDTCAQLESMADEVVCLHVPHPFFGVGRFYQQFDQTSDDEVIHLLQAARAD